MDPDIFTLISDSKKVDLPQGGFGSVPPLFLVNLKRVHDLKKAGSLLHKNTCLPHPVFPAPASVDSRGWKRMIMLDAIDMRSELKMLKDTSPLTEVWYKETPSVGLIAFVLEDEDGL